MNTAPSPRAARAHRRAGFDAYYSPARQAVILTDDSRVVRLPVLDAGEGRRVMADAARMAAVWANPAGYCAEVVRH